MPEPTSFRSRMVLMTAEDWRRFSEALKRSFPDAVYVMNPIREQTHRPRSRPPRLLISDDFFRIRQAAARWDAQISMIFDPQWRPHWHYVEDRHTGSYWSYWPPRHPSVDFRQLTGFRQIAGQPADIRDTWIDFRCNPAFPEHFLLAGRFYRLLGKFCSNRNLVEVEYPGGQVVETFVDKGAWRWVGHDARRWALSHPSHFLEVHGQKQEGLRPLPDNTTDDAGPKRRRRPRKDGAIQGAQDEAATSFAYRSHFVAMRPSDVSLLSTQLAKVFPGAVYYMEPLRGQWLRETPRVLAARDLYRIWKYARLWHSSVRMVFDPLWQPALRRRWTPYGRPGWHLWPPRLPHVHFENISGVYQPKGLPPSVRLGLVSLQYDSAMPVQCHLADSLVRVLAKVATNRGFEEVDVKTGEVTARFIDGEAWAWVGHDARRWALESPDHFAAIASGGVGLRPLVTQDSNLFSEL